MYSPRPALPHAQRGAATLLISLVLLVTVTLVVIITARSAFMDQRITGNELRTKIAFEAAQGALDFAISHRRTDGITNNTLEPNDFSRTRFLHPNATPNECPNSPGDLTCSTAQCNPDTDAIIVQIVACGWSDDFSARQMVVETIRTAPSIGMPPSYPVISRGGVNISGAGLVRNMYSERAIWTGSSVADTGARPKLEIRNPTDPSRPPAPPTMPPYEVEVTEQYVDDRWQDLTNMNDDEFFKNFFGTEPDIYRENHTTAENRFTKAEFEGLSNDQLDALAGQTVWVDVPASQQLELTGGELGTADHPITLIVNGNLRVAGNGSINGVVYVSDTLFGAGTFAINGSAVVANEVQAATGTFDVIFDPDIVRRASRQGQQGAVGGTWRDWL